MIPTTEALLQNERVRSELKDFTLAARTPAASKRDEDMYLVAETNALVSALRDAILAALVEGEGLDFEAAKKEADACGHDWSFRIWRERFDSALDRQHRVRVGALRARAAELEAELRNIANAKPREWDTEASNAYYDFYLWTQNRARFALKEAR